MNHQKHIVNTQKQKRDGARHETQDAKRFKQANAQSHSADNVHQNTTREAAKNTTTIPAATTIHVSVTVEHVMTALRQTRTTPPSQNGDEGRDALVLPVQKAKEHQEKDENKNNGTDGTKTATHKHPIRTHHINLTLRKHGAEAKTNTANKM